MSSSIINQLIFFSFSISFFLFLLLIINKPKTGKYISLALYFLASAVVFYSCSLESYSELTIYSFFVLYGYQLTIPFLFLYAQIMMQSGGQSLSPHVFWCFSPIIISIHAFVFNNEILFLASIIIEEFIIPVLSGIVLFQLYRFRQNLKKRYSNIQKKDLRWLATLFAAEIVFWLTYTLFELISSDMYGLENHSLALSFSVVIVLYLGIWGIRFTDSFQFEKSLENGSRQGKMAENQVAALKESICLEMEKGLYLNPDLSLGDISEMLSASDSYVSEILNTHMNTNFYDFVNQYRVQHVCKILQPENLKNKTILAIALESGFNSKASFNRIFKKHTGKTPSQYIKSS